jgi:hypothetical protein
MRTNTSIPDAVDCFNSILHFRYSDYYRTALQTHSLVTMALIDKVPGDLNLYIGGYVMQTTVSNSPTASVCPSGACDNWF